MILKFLKAFCIFFISFNLIVSTSSAEIIKSIEIRGNERISNETIIMFSNVSPGSDINSNDLNIILKNIYDSNFFDNVSVNFSNNILSIDVNEFPIIQTLHNSNEVFVLLRVRIIESLLYNTLFAESFCQYYTVP